MIENINKKYIRNIVIVVVGIIVLATFLFIIRTPMFLIDGERMSPSETIVPKVKYINDDYTQFVAVIHVVREDSTSVYLNIGEQRNETVNTEIYLGENVIVQDIFFHGDQLFSVTYQETGGESAITVFDLEGRVNTQPATGATQ